MNSIKSILASIFLLIISVSFIGCKEDDAPIPVVSITISDLAADPGTGFDPSTGQPLGLTKKFTFFSFETGALVANADSASAKWDLGFNGSTIIVNSATSGPGTTQAQIVTGIFDELTEAPATGYLSDNDEAPIASAPNANLAIPTGSGKGWYTYDGAAMVNRPTAGKIIVVKSSNGRFAKMEILSYYNGAPAAPTSSDVARYYTFRYVYQPNDTRKFN